MRARGLRRDDVVVSSKWGYEYTAGWRVDAEHHEIKELSAERLRTQWAESQALLGEWLALYQIHSATLDSGVLDDPGVREQLDAIRAGGVRVGLSVTGAAQAATIDRAVEGGGFDEVQATWNLHERSAGAALARAHDAGMEVYVKEALANGRLTDRGAAPALVAAAAERGVTRGCARARGRARAAVGGRGAQRRGDRGAAREQPDRGGRGVGFGARGRVGGAGRGARAYWERRSALPWN